MFLRAMLLWHGLAGSCLHGHAKLKSQRPFCYNIKSREMNCIDQEGRRGKESTIFVNYINFSIFLNRQSLLKVV